MAGEDDHHVSPHPVVHSRTHGSSRSSSRALGGGPASPRRGSRGESLEGSGGGSSSNSSRHHHSFSISRSSAIAAVYTRSSSTSSDEDFWPHRTSPSRSNINSSSITTHTLNTSSSSGGIGSGTGSTSAHTSLRLAFQSRGGGSTGRVERAEVVGGGDQQSSFGWAAGGRGGDNHGHRRSSLFLSLVDSEGSSRSRSIEHCLEVAPEPSSFGAMLPGVEVARRRRVRLAEPYEGGGGFGGGHHNEAGQSSRSSRSSSGVTVAHHHHYHHHHHHHHVHHQAARHPSRPGTPRPGSLVRRMQDILQEHRARSPFQQISNTASSSSSSSTDRTSAPETNSTQSSSHHHSSRGHGHRLGDGESRIAPLSSLWRRQPSDSSSNLRGAALEARNRLDERLRAAAHASRSRRSWQAVQSSYDMNLHFSDDEEDNFWSDDDGGERETSLNEWLAVWAPTAWGASTSVEERWNRVESSGPARASSSRNPTFKPRPSEGLSKAAINALPRQVVGSSRTQGGNNRSKMEQEDCPVCLEGFLQGQSLMALPCNHRFHPECLTPWLQNHGQCPYCRADIVKDIDTSSDHKNSSRLMGGSDEELLSWVEAIERGMDRLSYS